MQKLRSEQDTVVGSPVYWVAAGRTRAGADQEPPSHWSTEPDSSAAMQKVAVGQEIESRPPCGSIVCGGVQGWPGWSTQRSAPLTMAQSVVIGQPMAAACGRPAAPGGSEVVQGDGSCDQPLSSQSSTDVPTTARHIEEVGQVIPTRPRS